MTASNGNSTWTRCVFTILVAVLVAVLGGLAYTASDNKAGVASNSTAIKAMQGQLDRIEDKLDRALLRKTDMAGVLPTTK